tara:strand:- start:2065 stop:3096 length:1032 start_codon:yes stop_codon:yes gene_type:complete
MVTDKKDRIKVSGQTSGFTITMSAYVYQRMRYLVDNVDAEVAWLGTVEKKGNAFNITEIYVFNQEVTGSSVSAESDDIAALTNELIEKQGKEKTLMDIVPNLRAFCHSHHTMKTFWSATDEDGIDGLGNSQFLISLVLNRAGSMLGRVDFFAPHRIIILDVPVSIDYAADFDDLELDIKDKVSIQKTVMKSTYKPYQFNSAWTGSASSTYTTSLYSLPNLVAKTDPELIPAVKAVNLLFGKSQPIKDLGFLIFSVAYDSDAFAKRQNDLLNIFDELHKLANTTPVSKAVINEINECIYALASQDLITKYPPERYLKPAPASSVVSLLLIKYRINVNTETCLQP